MAYEINYKVFDVINEITEAKGSIAKKKVLESNLDNEDLKAIFNFVFNPFITSGISDKKLSKVQSKNFETLGLGLIETMDYIKEHNTGRDIDVSQVIDLVNVAESKYPESNYGEIIKKIFCQKFHDLGVSTSTINKVWKGLIPTFEVQLAAKYYDNPDVVKGKSFTLTEKLDGFRTVAKKENGKVYINGRSGKEFTGLVDIVNDMESWEEDNFVLDTEGLIADREKYPSKMQYKLTSKILSSDEEEKHGICLNAFDYLTLEEWNNQKCTTPYSERRKKLEHFKDRSKNVVVVPALYSGDDISMIDKLHKQAKDNNQEGIMVNLNDAFYEFKRTKNLLKCKTFLECDAYIDGMECGKGKNADRLGALKCHFVDEDGDTVNFDCGGGFTDENRDYFWNHQDEVIGRVGEFSYFEITKDKDGNKSIRFPTFKCLKDAGVEPHNFD